jgi:hypothetical protein
MVDHQEIPGIAQEAKVISVDNLPKEGWGLGNKLRIQPEILSQAQWQELLSTTASTGDEKALTITWDGRKLATYGDVVSTKKSSGLDIFPRGFRSILSRHETSLVSLHTHPMPPEFDHIQTMPFSDLDINSFINDQSAKASVSIDRGGVHMLAKSPYAYAFYLDPAEKPVSTVAEEALDEESAKKGLAGNIMKKIGRGLIPFGIKYYYSPNLSLAQDGFVELTDVSEL